MDNIISGVLIGLALATSTTMVIVGVVNFVEMLVDFFVKVHDEDN